MSTIAENSPFHAGEQDVQSRLGVRDKIEEIGQRFIRDHLPEQHAEFYRQLPMLVVGSVDKGGRPWASVLVGRHGFIETPDERQLRLNTRPIYGDPVGDNLVTGAPLGVLGIQYDVRRRNRLSARVEAADDSGITLSVVQTFGNCPQYIQSREPILLPEIDSLGDERPTTTASVLNQRAREIIAGADHFYIATSYDENPAIVHGFLPGVSGTTNTIQVLDLKEFLGSILA